MVAAGYDLEEILEHWTPAMLVRFAGAAAQRRRSEWLLLAQVVSIGVGSGFSGKDAGISALARALGLPYSGGSRAPKASVGDLVSRLYARIGGTHGGGHGRAARGRARGPQR